MVRTTILGLLIALIPAATAIAWPEYDDTASRTTADWNSPEYDGLWISLSSAEDEAISISDLLQASERPLRAVRR